jgi:DNA-binding response OmpR family regulator
MSSPHPSAINNETATAPSVHILVIDDDPNTLKTLAGLLRASGYEATESATGREGIELARRIRPSVIICDVTMPEMDGYDVLRALKKDLHTAVIPFIFLSGNLDHDFVRQGMGLGADDYLTKPFQPDQLFASIRARIERQRVITCKLEQLRVGLAQSVPSEFFTPLNAVLGFSMLALDTVRAGEEIKREDLEDSLESIHSAGEQLLRIASNCVLFTQLSTEDGMPHETPPPLPAEAWEPDLSRAVRKLALGRNRMKDFHYSFAPATLKIKREHLEKIVIELLDNALKFSRPTEWAAVTGTVENNRYILRVSDHGRGMTPEQIESLAPLVQFDRALLVQSGVGLGLHLARLLATRYAGTFAIAANNNGSGITVQVTLPIVTEQAES